MVRVGQLESVVGNGSLSRVYVNEYIDRRLICETWADALGIVAS